MIRDISLNAPGDTGVFEPFSNTVGLDFDIEELYPDITRPAPGSWQLNWKLFHEWAHFYQFATTNYGFYYHALASVQLLLTNGFLRVYMPRRRRYRLPLLRGQPLRTFPEVMNSGDGENGGLHVRQIQWIDDYRRAIYGYAAKPELRDVSSYESRLMLEVLHDMFDFPKVMVYWPAEGQDLGQNRFRITDFLESHAFALATLWIAQVVERFGLPKSIVPEAQTYANTAAIGPYNAFLRYSEWLPAEPEKQLHLFCLLCDMSLNPPGPGMSPGATGPTGRPTTFVMPDTTWAPVTRLWQLIIHAHGGTMPAYRADSPEYLEEFPRALQRSLDLQGGYFPPYSGPQYDPRPMINRIVRFNDVPEALEMLILERLLTFEIAQRARRTMPYLLGGNSIDELVAVTKYLAGPSGICHLAGRRRKVLFRICMGLMTEGLIRKNDPTNAASDQLLWSGMPFVETLRLLLQKSRPELEPIANQPLFAGAGPSLAGVLDYYGLQLQDFD